jgi:hypothetical protein
MADGLDREARRKAHFAQMQGTFPFRLLFDDIRLPGAATLDDDEFVVRTARDWGVTVKPLILTTRRLVCPSDLSGGRVATIPLTDIRRVTLRKHAIGFATIVIETTDEQQASFPAHINGALMRADIAAMADFAQRAVAPKLSVVSPPSPGGDRYEQLRRIGELKKSGVLSEAEFQEEKARILKQP